MLFMVIERFDGNDMVPLYRRMREAGRGLPDGLIYMDSWIAADFSRCFQLMKCHDAVLLHQWVLHWRGTGAIFEIVPVAPSAQTRPLTEAVLDKPQAP